MKALINCHHEHMEWVGRFFPGENPYLLPVVNKPLLEYWLDFCSMNEIRDLMIVDSEYDSQMEIFLGTGSKWALNIQYIGDNTDADCKRLISHHRNFLEDREPMLVFNGLFFQHYNRNRLPDLEVLLAPDTPKITSGDGMLAYADGAFQRIDCRITQLCNIRDFFKLNQFVLQEECDNYVIPGYKIDNGIYTGINNVIPPTCTINPPAVLGDNVSLGGKCTLTGGAIVGDNVIADSRCVIGESIIMKNTYLGADLEFIGKIVSRNTVIDPQTDTVVDLLDAQVAGELMLKGRGRFGPGRLMGWLTALIILLCLFPAYCLFLLLGVRSAGKKKYYACGRKMCSRTAHFSIYPECADIALYRYFRALSLDKIPLLKQVLSGGMRLVGDYPYDAEEPGTEDFIRHNYQHYQPGAFWRSEQKHAEENYLSLVIDDLYFDHNHTLTMEFLTILRNFIGRLFDNHDTTR